MTATADHTGTVTGRVVRVTGPVVDIEFPRGQVPELYNALEVPVEIGDPSLVTTRTLPTRPRRRRAAVRPAMPDPITTTSALTDQPGSGACRRPTTRRTVTHAG